MLNKKLAVILLLLLLIVAYFILRNDKPVENKSEIVENSNMAKVNKLKIEDIKVGTGETVMSGETVVINYQGNLEDGTEFDSSYKRNKPFETQIGVGRVIKGWDEGVVGMKVGGKRKLTIPYTMAYGEEGIPGSIPPKATLIFTLELLEIKK